MSARHLFMSKEPFENLKSAKFFFVRNPAPRHLHGFLLVNLQSTTFHLHASLRNKANAIFWWSIKMRDVAATAVRRSFSWCPPAPAA
jgi:hypothetical protein